MTSRARGIGPSKTTTHRPLFQLEVDEVDGGRAGVLHGPRLPCILPDEIAFVRSHPAVGRSRHHLGQYAAVDVDSETRGCLRDLSRRPPGVTGGTPTPRPAV